MHQISEKNVVAFRNNCSVKGNMRWDWKKIWFFAVLCGWTRGVEGFSPRKDCWRFLFRRELSLSFAFLTWLMSNYDPWISLTDILKLPTRNSEEPYWIPSFSAWSWQASMVTLCAMWWSARRRILSNKKTRYKTLNIVLSLVDNFSFDIGQSFCMSSYQTHKYWWNIWKNLKPMLFPAQARCFYKP